MGFRVNFICNDWQGEIRKIAICKIADEQFFANSDQTFSEMEQNLEIDSTQIDLKVIICRMRPIPEKTGERRKNWAISNAPSENVSSSQKHLTCKTSVKKTPEQSEYVTESNRLKKSTN